MAEFEPVGLGAFVTGVNEGWKNMNARLKEADELRLASRAWDFAEAQDKARKEKGEPTGTTIGPPISAATGPGADPSDPGSATGTWSATNLGDTSQTGEGHVATKAERLAYYQEQAAKLGLNYAAIAATVGTEGLNVYHGDRGDGGGSYGDFQLHLGGGSMGDAAVAAGINVKDPNTWKQQADFAFQQMLAHKGDANWYASQWHGPRGKAPWAVQNFSNPDATPPAGYLPSTTQTAATPPAEGAPAPLELTPASAIGAPLRGVPSTAAPEATPAPTETPPAAPVGAPTSTAAIGPGGRATFPPGSTKVNSQGVPYTADLGHRPDQKNELTHPNWPTTSGQQPYFPPGVTPPTPAGAIGGPPASAAPAALAPGQTTNAAPPPQQTSQIAALASLAQQHGLDLTLSPRGGSGLYNNTSMG